MDERRDGPRERLMAHGGERIGDAELLGVILGTGVRGRSAVAIAEEMLRAAGGLAALSRASPRELVRVAGIGEARALRVAAAFHVGRRAVDTQRAASPKIISAADVWMRLRGRVAGLTQEVFLVLGVDAKQVVLEEVEVARGTLTGVDVHPRDVFRPLIRMSAAAGVLAHNHPSGDPRPSLEDVALTRRMQEIGAMVGIPIVDHIVVAANGYTSIAELVPDLQAPGR
jgi:DNA repair protein RadC